jgi:MFS family permease
MVGLGNVVGPFLAAAFVSDPSKTSWRALFWTICPLAFVAGTIVAVVLPPSRVNGTVKEKIKAIDYLGTIFSASAVMLLLIPISGGGTYFPWESAMVISMLVLGGICAIIFVVIEWKFAFMPMMPLHLFKIPAVSAILIQNVLLGIVYYSHLYFLPIFYQNARLFSPVKSAALTIPLVAGQAFFSVLSGQYISRTKRYGEVIWAGYALWTLGAGLTRLFNLTTPNYVIIIVLIIEGAGVGFVFQPTLVAAQAHSTKQDRAVVISVRNFLRAFGGAAGLALSSAVFSNVLKSHLSGVSEELKTQILQSILKVPDLQNLATGERSLVLEAYSEASRGVFIIWAPLMGACVLLCFLIKDKGLQRAEEKTEEGLAAQDSVSEVAIKEEKIVDEEMGARRDEKHEPGVKKVHTKGTDDTSANIEA